MDQAPARIGAVRPKHPAQPVYLLDVHAVRGERTRADGALWDGVLNATPDDTNDAPSPIEALMAALAGCLVRNLRSMADGRRITFERADLHIAATRSDDPPVVTSLIVDLDVVADAEPERVQRMVEQAAGGHGPSSGVGVRMASTSSAAGTQPMDRLMTSGQARAIVRVMVP